MPAWGDIPATAAMARTGAGVASAGIAERAAGRGARIEEFPAIEMIAALAGIAGSTAQRLRQARELGYQLQVASPARRHR